MFLTEEAIEGYKKYTENVIKSADIKIGETYYPTTIHKKERLENGSVAIYLLIDHTIEGDVTISEVRLFDIDDKIWLVKPENIIRKAMQEGVLYRFTIDIKENEE
jgi:hypothetical protein